MKRKKFKTFLAILVFLIVLALLFSNWDCFKEGLGA
jgi:hypothetical protein